MGTPAPPEEKKHLKNVRETLLLRRRSLRERQLSGWHCLATCATVRRLTHEVGAAHRHHGAKQGVLHGLVELAMEGRRGVRSRLRLVLGVVTPHQHVVAEVEIYRRTVGNKAVSLC